jgi:N-acyl amino acid synthase of PEP-CTERM/exosortase system
VSAMISIVDAPAEQSALAANISQQPLIDVYRTFFDFRVVKSQADRDAAHMLRYEVYCEETGYLSKDDNILGVERDEYDAHSVQSILQHRSSNRTAGTVRLVLPMADKPGCHQPSRMFASALDTLPDSVLPRSTTAEISRLAIHPSFRRRLGDGLYANIFAGNQSLSPDFDPRRIIPHITIGLFASIFQMTRENSLTHLCAIIDPALLRMLSRLGLHFNMAGERIDFHGPRQPVYASGSELLERLADEQPEIYELIISSSGM